MPVTFDHMRMKQIAWFSTLIFSFVTISGYAGIHMKSLLSESPSDPDEPIVYHPNQYFVEIDSLTPEDTILALLTEFNSTEVWEDDDLNLALWQVNSFPFTLPSGQQVLDIDQVITSSKKKTRIRSATFNVRQLIAPDQISESGTCFNLSDYHNPQGDEKVRISILDTGISDISDNSTSEFNYQLTSYTGFDYVNNDAIPEDEHGHGSHIAGLIHSIVNPSGIDTSNILFDIRKTHNAAGEAFTSNVVFALLDAINADADIINMSFSLNDIYNDSIFYPLKNAIEYAEKEGVLVVASSGNEGQDNDGQGAIALPASFSLPNIIAVGGYNCLDELTAFSNYGHSTVDLLAPSVDLPGPDMSQGIVMLSGTSQATAIITAIAAIKGSNEEDFHYEPVKCSLLNSSKHLVDIADKTSTESVVDPTAFFIYNTLNCMPENSNCDADLGGSDPLSGSPTANQMWETNLNISSDEILSSGLHTTYDAKGVVELFNGFTIQSGALFQVLQDGCDH